MAVRMRKVLDRPWVNVWVCHWPLLFVSYLKKPQALSRRVLGPFDQRVVSGGFPLTKEPGHSVLDMRKKVDRGKRS